ncbi:hypothetical protein Zm00014a_038764 [Zea mays]|uniref:Uncharacterized protein n=1 Tax=Zea mays TaxID=4577 RepID=A0A3L6E443_MAIZE|nr:hypothetical protein Zm00014a_038764 [Zea mays]
MNNTAEAHVQHGARAPCV